MSARGKRASVTAIHSAPKLRAVGEKRKYTRLADEAMGKLDDQVRALIAADACSKPDFKAVAARFDVSVRTVQGRLAAIRRDGPAAGRDVRLSGHSLPDGVLVSIAAARQVAGVHADLVKKGEYRGSLSTFYRQVHNAHGARTVRGVTGGVDTMRRGTFERIDVPLFTQGYSLDLFYLRAPLAGGRPGDKPMGALVREASTQVIVASWIWPTDQVSAEDAATLLAEAFRGRVFWHREQAVFVGGVPDFLRCDNGGQFTSRSIGRMLNPLAVRVITSNDYRSNENGAHEVVHRLLRAQLLDHLPGSEDGHRDHRKQLLPDDRAHVSLADARDMLDRWCWAFNTRDDGKGSRMDAWAQGIEESDGTLPATVSPATLAGYAIERRTTAKLYKLGVLVDTHYYTCAALEDYPHRRFVVRRWLRDDRTVELFTPEGRYVGVAARNGDLTAAESGALHASAGEAERAVKAIIATAQVEHPLPDFPDVPVAHATTTGEPAGDPRHSDPWATDPWQTDPGQTDPPESAPAGPAPRPARTAPGELPAGPMAGLAAALRTPACDGDAHAGPAVPDEEPS